MFFNLLAASNAACCRYTLLNDKTFYMNGVRRCAYAEFSLYFQMIFIASGKYEEEIYKE